MTTGTFSIWALGDLHLSFGIKNKSMDIFGKEWEGWTDKIRKFWCEKIAADDLVLIPGDISWAMHPEEAIADLNWIDSLPGTKVMIRGNHDYWWGSKNKVKSILPASIHMIQNDAFHFHSVSIAGARLWDTPEYHFYPYIDVKEGKAKPSEFDKASLSEEDEKIFTRELLRLEMSLQQFKKDAGIKIVMTHYPPIGSDLKESRASKLLEKYHAQYCVFGHLHSVKANSLPFGDKNGIHYALTSCDYLNFTPLKICTLDLI